MKRILIIWALLISVCFAQSKPGFYVVGGKIITVQDTSSRKYLKAIENAGVVPSVTQNFASNYLVNTEKAISTYSLITAQYPFIGGTASTHKFNLNDPRDADGAYRLSFPNGGTHSSNGVVFNGTTQYANTFVIPNAVMTNTSSHLSIYSNINTGDATATDIGTRDASGSNYLNMSIRYSGNLWGGRMYGSASAYTNTSSNGYYLQTKTVSTVIRSYKNGIIFSPDNTSAGSVLSMTTLPIFFGAVNNSGSAFLFSKQPYQLITIGAGFTDTQAILQSRAVTSFEGFLGRQ